MEKIKYRGHRCIWQITNRLNKDTSFILTLSGFMTSFIGPYLVVLMQKEGAKISTRINPAKITSIGWTARMFWFLPLITFQKMALEEGRDVELIDHEGGLGILIGNAHGKCSECSPRRPDDNS